jgi:hypothetical protein
MKTEMRVIKKNLNGIRNQMENPFFVGKRENYSVFLASMH